MIITYKKGNKGIHDRILMLKTEGIDGVEAFTIFKTFLLVNQLSINERLIRRDNGYNYNYFEPALLDCLKMSEQGLDWSLEENEPEIIKFARKHHLNYETITKELARIRQYKLNISDDVK